MTNIADQTLASIVTQNHQVVPVLEKHHLDFCCKGKTTLKASCKEKGISVEELIAELENVTNKDAKFQQPFNEMTAEQLIGYILIHHHFYVKQSMPSILSHVEKVAEKHGARFPNMVKVFQLFKAINEEMTLHMQKEEKVLFPRIKEIEVLLKENKKISVYGGYINNPISVMEHEHDHAGAVMAEISALTNNYTPPEDACTTFKVSLTQLKEFEEDLHKHVHLENYILFPLAEKILMAVAE